MMEVLDKIKAFKSKNLGPDEMEESINFTVKYFIQIPNSESKIINENDKEIFLEAIKYLKFVCTQGQSFQNLIANSENLLESVKNLIIQETANENNLKVLQLVANLCVGNATIQKKVWNVMNEIILDQYENGDNITVNVCGMIIYNTILEKSYSLDERKIATISIHHYEQFLKNPDNLLPDFVQILLEHFICNCKWIVEYFKRLEPANQINLLYFVNDHIENESNKQIHPALLQVLIVLFQAKSDCIMKTVTTYVDQINPNIVVVLIDIISSAVTQDKYMTNLKENHSLFLNLGCLLQMLHKIGKSSESIFTPIQKLDAVAPAGKFDAEFEKEISFNMKTRLVKCLANLLHKNERNQELVREMEILHCILECTIADARNPLIKEWSVLAIKNLCENNKENQEIVRNLTKLKNVENPVLKEFGLDLNTLRIGK